MLFLQSPTATTQEELHHNHQKKGMREEDEDHTNWFSRWEDQLPAPEELTPLTQTLITPDLAVAFDITPNPSPPPPPSTNPPPSSSSEFADSAGPDEPARTLKRPRLVWTPQLHKRFVDAVAHLGIKNAVPKTIMQLMNVDGLTRENVASHLQKYRLYLKRMQGLSAGGGAADAAADRLFATAPVPHHFLHRGSGSGGGGEHFMPFVPVAAAAALQQHHHQMAAAAAQQQQQRYMGHFGAQALHRGMPPAVPGPAYVEDLEAGGGGRKVLTLFPTGED